MEMQQVRYFVSVAQTLNFTRAAEACHVTQPALTRAIKALEAELGGDLIRREGRATQLTDLGRQMLPLLRQCYESALSAKSVARSVASGETSPTPAMSGRVFTSRCRAKVAAETSRPSIAKPSSRSSPKRAS